MVLSRILTCRGRLPRANRSYSSKWRTANQIAERPLVSQSRGRATNSLWGRDWPGPEILGLYQEYLTTHKPLSATGIKQGHSVADTSRNIGEAKVLFQLKIIVLLMFSNKRSLFRPASSVWGDHNPLPPNARHWYSLLPPEKKADSMGTSNEHLSVSHHF